jgi:hypothetical protein
MKRNHFFLALGLSILLLLGGSAASGRAQEGASHRAGLVIVHGDGRVITHCVAFDADHIDGAELLRRSGLEVVFGTYGGLGYGVCAIDGEGCEAGQDCFCECRRSPCAYWTYSHRRPDGSWAISGVGASSWEVGDGAVDGWVWGDGAVPPPELAFDDVCAPPASTPALSPSPAPTPSSPPTVLSTPVPSPPSTLPTGYLVLGLILAGLLAALVAGLLRRR